MRPTVSIVVVQYEPNRERIERTLLSILTQEDQDFELLIADDGSVHDEFTLSESILKQFHRTAVFVKLPENRGTVWNFWNAVSKANGAWVYGISPGDYLYDRKTVSWIKETAQKENAAAFFGKAAYYTDKPELKQLPGETPYDRSCYCKNAYSAKKIKRNMLLYDDGISGACVVYNRTQLLSTLAEMKGRVKFAEDLALRLYAVQEKIISCYDRVLCWYEEGTGISNSHDKMLSDWQEMILIMREQYPHDWIVYLAYLYFFNESRKSRLLRGLVGRLIVPQWLPFKRRQNNFKAPINGKLQELSRLYQMHQEELS